jgi:hypothetical protein
MVNLLTNKIIFSNQLHNTYIHLIDIDMFLRGDVDGSHLRCRNRILGTFSFPFFSFLL